MVWQQYRAGQERGRGGWCDRVLRMGNGEKAPQSEKPRVCYVLGAIAIGGCSRSVVHPVVIRACFTLTKRDLVPRMYSNTICVKITEMHMPRPKQHAGTLAAFADKAAHARGLPANLSPYPFPQKLARVQLPHVFEHRHGRPCRHNTRLPPRRRRVSFPSPSWPSFSSITRTTILAKARPRGSCPTPRCGRRRDSSWP